MYVRSNYRDNKINIIKEPHTNLDLISAVLTSSLGYGFDAATEVSSRTSSSSPSNLTNIIDPIAV